MIKIGIIGGLGPSATIDLYRLITKNTSATKDQEHLRLIIDSHPQIPDRTAFLMNNNLEDPSEKLLESIRLLEQADCKFLACPCNTAHIFLRKLKPEMKAKFIDMITETITELKSKNIQQALLLSTKGTANSRIYQETALSEDIEILTPSEEEIKQEMQAIYGPEGIKAGVQFEKSAHNQKIFLNIIKNYQQKGINTFILGCTEIPLCIDKSLTNANLINPTEILAKSIIKATI